MGKKFLSTPSARRATESLRVCGRELEFLSTPSARRATFSPFGSTSNSAFLSTPSARRATLLTVYNALKTGISIHALREEGDGRMQLTES